MNLSYALRTKDDRHFICIIPGDRDTTDLNAEERKFVQDCDEFVLDYEMCSTVWVCSALKKSIDNNPNFTEDTVGGNATAKGILDYMEEEGSLDKDDYDDDDDEL